MRSAEFRRLFAAAAICLAGAAFAAPEEKSTYGKVDTFEPGKKYSCLPTADHKGWDCTQTGKASDQRPAAAAPTPPAPVPAPQQNAATSATTAAAPAAPPAAAPAPSATRSGELPSYLSAAAASGGPAPRQSTAPPTPTPAPATAREPAKPQSAPAPVEQPVAAAPPPKPAPAPAEPIATTPTTPVAAPAATTPVATPPTPAPKPEPTTVAAPTERVAQKPEPAAAPTQAEASAAPATAPPAPHRDAAKRGDDAFLALAADQYVIELAHAGSEAELDAANVQPARGDVYKLHLRQNGAEVWLLVCGSFDDVSAARAARAEIAASATVTPGWPRRVGPLQAEVRRAGN